MERPEAIEHQNDVSIVEENRGKKWKETKNKYSPKPPIMQVSKSKLTWDFFLGP